MQSQPTHLGTNGSLRALLSIGLLVVGIACQTAAPSLQRSGADELNGESSSSSSSSSSGASTEDGDEDETDDDNDDTPTPTDRGCTKTGDLTTSASLRESVTFLASPQLGGRAPGTPGDTTVRQHIEDAFRCIGLKPGADGGKFQQPFVNSDGASTANVIGFLKGTDPVVGNQIIVIGAHHDHFGTIGGEGLRLGANDNASGLAGLLATADAIKRAGGTKRTIAFIAFGAEETLTKAPWDEGSAFYVTHVPTALPLANVAYVITMDMIGTYSSSNNLDAMGTAAGTPGRTILQGLLGKFPEIDVTLDADAEEGDSDFDPFCRRGIPYVGFYTSDDACYHKSCDTADRIDYDNMARIVRLNVDLTTGLGNSTTDLIAAKAKISDPCRFQ